MQCDRCGTELPDQARFCLNCGAPVPTVAPAAPPQPPPDLDFVQPALAGGMFLGVMSSMPIIQAGNCLCCMWVLGGGGIAAYLLMKQRPSGITYGDAAFGGVMSGLFGAIVATMISIPMRLLMSRMYASQEEAFEQMLREYPIEGPMRDWMLQIASAEITAQGIIYTFITNLLIFALFAMVGGILTVAVMKNQRGRRQPPSPIPS